MDVGFSIFLYGALALMLGGYTARSLWTGRTRQRRLDGGEGALLGRPFMEAGYWFFSPLVTGLLAIGATPNAVTAFALLPAAAGAVALATGHFGLAAFMGTVAGICDLLDGAVARRLGTSSDAGEVFDAAVDRYGEFLFLAGLAIRYRVSWPLEAMTLAAILGSFMVSYATAKAEALGLEPPKGLMRRAERAFYLHAGAGLVPLVALLLPPAAAARILIHDAPVLVPLTLIAVLANGSAVSRLFKTAALARAAAAAARTRGATALPKAV